MKENVAKGLKETQLVFSLGPMVQVSPIHIQGDFRDQNYCE